MPDVNSPQFGIGLAALGRPGYINLGHAEDLDRDYKIDAMEQRAHRVLDAAWQAGVRYFDTARSYGRAEAFLGSWIRDRSIASGDITVGSKWGYTYTADWKVQTPEGVAHEVKRHELDVLQRQHAESLGELGEHLDLYQIHSATIESGVLDNEEVLQHLAGLRENGLKIGLSVSGPRQADTIHKALSIKQHGAGLLFDSVQATWNLLERSAGPALQLAHDAGLTVIVKETLANGRLTPRNRDPDFEQKFLILKEAADRKNATVDALALAAVWNQPFASIVLSGAGTVQQMRSNVAAASIEWDSETERQLGSIGETPDDYWKRRSSLVWN